MSLIAEIQDALLREGSPIGPILLKTRFVAHRLGVVELEDWVKHELDGYGSDVPVPDYRLMPVSYTGLFVSYTTRAVLPIAPYYIEKFAGENWNERPMRQSIGEVDDLLNQGEQTNNGYSISPGNLQLLLNHKVYPDHELLRVDGSIGRQSIVRIQNAVRSKLLDLTLQLEKSIPAVREITVGGAAAYLNPSQREEVKQVVNQYVYGGTAIASSGEGSSVTLISVQGDVNALRTALVSAGLTTESAGELAQIVSEEQPQDAEQPFGARAKVWLGTFASKAADAGLAIGQEIAKDAIMRYYGLK